MGGRWCTVVTAVVDGEGRWTKGTELLIWVVDVVFVKETEEKLGLRLR